MEEQKSGQQERRKAALPDDENILVGNNSKLNHGKGNPEFMNVVDSKNSKVDVIANDWWIEVKPKDRQPNVFAPTRNELIRFSKLQDITFSKILLWVFQTKNMVYTRNLRHG